MVLILSVPSSYYLCYLLDHEFVFDSVFKLILVILNVLLFTFILFKDKKEFNNSKKWLSFSASVSYLLILFFFIGKYYSLKQKDISPIILKCKSEINDFNGISIEFRKDGTYKLTSWCIGADYYRGNYQLKDSIIILDKNLTKDIIKSNKLLIINHHNDEISTLSKSIYQIDSNNQIIQNATVFEVVEY